MAEFWGFVTILSAVAWAILNLGAVLCLADVPIPWHTVSILLWAAQGSGLLALISFSTVMGLMNNVGYNVD